ncbi:MAG: MaoC family dehydratase [Sphingomonadales bacterium]
MPEKDLYLEDFTPGDTYEFGQYEVTESEIIEFASKYDPQPFHLDHEAAKATHFGGLVASGWHTCAMTMRMLIDEMMLFGNSLGSPGVDKIRWLRPVRPDDVLTARGTVKEVRPSRSRPEMGSVSFGYEVLNQKNEVVMTMQAISLFKRRSKT